jgi:transposase-like protein
MDAKSKKGMGTMGQKRKIHTEEFKARVALEAVKGVHSLRELSSVFSVHPVVIGQWKRKLIEKAPELFDRNNGMAGKTEDELTSPLYEEIGRLKMEIEWLKKKL